MSIEHYIVANGQILAEGRDGAARRYAADPLGSTAALVNPTEAITDTFTYWPYGAERTRTGTTATPFRYVGTLGYYRDDAGHTYVRARHLSRRTGRWTSLDRATPEHYIYAWLSPVTLTDPWGLSPQQGSSKGARPRPGAPIAKGPTDALGNWTCTIPPPFKDRWTDKCLAWILRGLSGTSSDVNTGRTWCRACQSRCFTDNVTNGTGGPVEDAACQARYLWCLSQVGPGRSNPSFGAPPPGAPNPDGGDPTRPTIKGDQPPRRPGGPTGPGPGPRGGGPPSAGSGGGGRIVIEDPYRRRGR